MHLYVALMLCLSVGGGSSNCHDDHSCTLKERHGGYKNRHFGKVLNNTARHIISAEEEYNHNCNIEIVNKIREVYRNDGFYLIYNLPNFNEEEFTVKIKHKVIYVNAQKDNGLSFRDVRILPQIIKPYEGFWSLDSGHLVIKFNYKGPLGAEVTADCSEHVTDHVQTLPRSTTGTLSLADLA